MSFGILELLELFGISTDTLGLLKVAFGMNLFGLFSYSTTLNMEVQIVLTQILLVIASERQM